MRNLRFVVSFRAVVQIDESLWRGGARIEWVLGEAQPIQYSTCSAASRMLDHNSEIMIIIMMAYQSS